MTQDHDLKRHVDWRNTVIRPSPQRIRNILTLEEKIAVINAYNQHPSYKKVARMFNCCWEQIKNIIRNRVAILDFYAASKSKKDTAVFEDEKPLALKKKKIKFLGECVYECIQRLQYHAKLPITEELITHKALEFLDVLRISGFSPTKKWLNLFKANYNITLSNKQITIYTEPQSSLDNKDIIAYCTKQNVNKSLLSKCNQDDNENAEYEAKRLRKLNFLQEALKEYMIRVKFHHKSMKLDVALLFGVAKEFNEILKVQDFNPTTEWIVEFKQRHESKLNLKCPPLSLDLKDILSYCSRMQNKTKDNTVTLAPKETALQMRVMPKYTGTSLPESDFKFKLNSFIYLDEQSGGGGEKDVKPDIKKIHVHVPPQSDIEEISIERSHLEQPPPLKIRKIESINNDPELQRKYQTIIETRKTPIVTTHDKPMEPPHKTPAKTIFYIQKVPANIAKENMGRSTPLSSIEQIKNAEPLDENNYILPTNTTFRTASPPQLRIQQVHEQVSLSCLSPHQPSHRIDDNDGVELPRHVTSFKDALLLLKPLEEYAMLKENYRAIGLITQLEEVLQNEPIEENTGDEEFIG